MGLSFVEGASFGWFQKGSQLEANHLGGSFKERHTHMVVGQLPRFSSGWMVFHSVVFLEDLLGVHQGFDPSPRSSARCFSLRPRARFPGLGGERPGEGHRVLPLGGLDGRWNRRLLVAGCRDRMGSEKSVGKKKKYWAFPHERSCNLFWWGVGVGATQSWLWKHVMGMAFLAEKVICHGQGTHPVLFSNKRLAILSLAIPKGSLDCFW